MADVARLQVEIDSDGVVTATGRLQNFSGSAKKTETATGKLVKSLKGLAVAYVGLRVARQAVTNMIRLERSLAEVASISPDAAQNLESIKDSIFAISTEIGSDAATTTKALYQAISAGVTDISEALNLVEVSTRAAVAGLTDETTAVDVITSAMNAYAMSGLTATRASDVLFTAVREGKTTFSELAGSMGRAMAISATAGVSFEDLTAAITTLTKGGVSTDEAVTSVRATIVSILKPTTEAAKFAEELGIEFSATALAAKGLGGILDDVRRATSGNAEAVSKLFPNVRALAGVLGLTGAQAEEFTRQLVVMQNTLGATDKAFEIMADTTDQRLKRLKASWGKFADQLVSVIYPALTLIINGLIATASAASETARRLGILISGHDEQGKSLRRLAAEYDRWEASAPKPKMLRSLADAFGEVEDAQDGLASLARQTAMDLRLEKDSIVELTAADKEALAIIEAMRLPQELLEEQMGQLHEAFVRGVVPVEAYQKAVSELRRQVIELNNTFRVVPIEIEGFTEAAAGSLRGLPTEIEGFTDAAASDIADFARNAESAVTGWSMSFVDNLFDAERRSKLTFESIATDFATMVAKMMAEQALLQFLKSLFPSAQGNAFNGGRVVPMARGGVVTSPTVFPMANGAGLMGEAGPEAVMPLTRTSSGDLGVKAEGVGSVVNVNIVNNTDARVTETRRQSGQRTDIDVMIGDAVASHIDRGRFDRAMGANFGMQRRGTPR